MRAQALDPLDLKLLQALQLDGRAPFNRIAEVLGVSDQTVARRFRRLRGTVHLRVLGITDERRLGRSTWILRLRCTPDGAEQLAGALARRPDTAYVSVISGGTEVMCAMKPRTRQARDELLLDRLQRTPRVISVSAHCLLHHFYGGPVGWLSKINALSPDEQADLSPPPVDPGTRPVALEDADEALLAVLGRDGRASITELQASTGLPESTVKRRLDRLRATGVLYLDVQFDHEHLGNEVVAMLWLTVTPAALANVGRALASHPEVRFAAATTGQANIVAATLHAGTGDLYTYLSDKIGALDGVQSVETALAMREVKQLAYEPGR
ncbi:Lrp/AsnC family transcriptional regulator [Streptomyces sp. NBC_00582]|uniref:Lrp/AsnC family transcriptional regulator n=1 Tax=Streptomyces sp. NBC_00582 TaxID=2975783 RepID=UPI002E81922F|nr:Lrp/AsnC family transcriptional regulator [Streptomyces sp. NBC_00582]WUB67532.1 Lrp/AsnC family transcriptional regulator [Streptomyces sp. NBC_00582]